MLRFLRPKTGRYLTSRCDRCFFLASLLTGAIYCEAGGPDYSEQPAATCRRLEAAFFNVEAIWDAERLRLGLSKKPKEQRELKFRFLRTRYRPTNLPPSCHGSIASPLVETPQSASSESSNPIWIPSEPEPPHPTAESIPLIAANSDSHLGSLSLPQPSTNGENTPKPEVPELPDSRYPIKPWKVHPDNSCEIEPWNPSAEKLDDTLIAMEWALDNGNHVACGRVTIRKAPNQRAWVFVNWMLEDVTAFMTRYSALQKIKSDSAERIELAKIAAEAKRLEVRKAKADDNRELHQLLEQKIQSFA